MESGSRSPFNTPWPEPAPVRHRSSGNAGLGIILIAIGGLLLIQRVTGLDVWHLLWPLFVIGPGVVFLAFAVGSGQSGLAIPGTIITTTGMILFVQNAFGLWQTWAYAWALVAPTSVGLGIWLAGFLSGNLHQQAAGRKVATIGIILFVGFAAFFEIIFSLSGFWHVRASGIIIGLLFVIGGFLLIRPRRDPSSWV
jgi:hypothetical protein